MVRREEEERGYRVNRPVKVLRKVPWYEWTREEQEAGWQRSEAALPPGYREKADRELRRVLEGYARYDPERIRTYRAAAVAHSEWLRELFAAAPCLEAEAMGVHELPFTLFRAEKAGIDLDAPIALQELTA